MRAADHLPLTLGSWAERAASVPSQSDGGHTGTAQGQYVMRPRRVAGQPSLKGPCAPKHGVVDLGHARSG